jgi:hypothetical protein
MNATAQTLFHIRVTASIGSIARVPLAGSPTSTGSRAVQRQLGGRHLFRAQLVLQPVDPDAIQLAAAIAQLDVKHRKALATGGIALGARQRQRHLRRDRGGEPLAAIQAPAIGVGFGARLRPPTSEPPVVSVIHWPLVHACGSSRDSRRGTA